MMTILAFLLGFQAGGDIESLIRDLADDRIEIRERSRKELIRIGTAAIPALKEAVKDRDALKSALAYSVLIIVDRSERERLHDARERTRLLSKLHPDFLESTKDKPLRFETSFFDISAFRRKEDILVSTGVQHLLMQYEGGKVGGFDLDLEIPAGGKVDVERCARCSPGMFLVKRPETGPLQVRLKGVQTWYSRYPLEFQDPRNGDMQQVGDMTIEVAWPQVIVRSKEGWPADSFSLRDPLFSCELRPEAAVKGLRMIGRVGGGARCGAGRPMPPRPGWCECESGPSVVRTGDRPRRIHELTLNTPWRDVSFKDVSIIRCVVWKPIQIPIDFTLTIPVAEPESE